MKRVIKGNVVDNLLLILPENYLSKLEAFARVTVVGYSMGEISKEEYNRIMEDIWKWYFMQFNLRQILDIII